MVVGANHISLYRNRSSYGFLFLPYLHIELIGLAYVYTKSAKMLL